jgi:hypothetical protein
VIVHTATLAGQTMDFALPSRISTRHDLSTSSYEQRTGQTMVRVWAAAILICWADRDSKAGKDRVPIYRGDVLAYGGDALDYLSERGVQIDQIAEVGLVLIEKVRASLVTAEQLEEARGNSGPPAGG